VTGLMCDVLDLDLIVLLWVPMRPFCPWFFCGCGLYVVCTSDFLYACPKCWIDWVL